MLPRLRGGTRTIEGRRMGRGAWKVLQGRMPGCEIFCFSLSGREAGGG